MTFVDFGAAYGTAKAGAGISLMGHMRPELVMKSILPVVMAGVIGIYGLIVAVLIVNGIPEPGDGERYSFQDAFKHLAAGLSVGFSGIGAGYAIGLVGDVGARATGLQPKLFVPLVLIMIFAEALALYGLIVGLILAT